ncbi:hypothetical protein YGAWVPHU_CDS0136 [Salmonella phage SeKF_13]
MNRRITAVSKDFYNRRMGELVKQFPNVFNKSLPMPLAIGVHKVLAEQTDFTRKEISLLCFRYGLVVMSMSVQPSLTVSV